LIEDTVYIKDSWWL